MGLEASSNSFSDSTVTYGSYGHEILHLESVGSVHCDAAGLESLACLLLPLLGSAAAAAAVADRHKSTGLCDDEIFVGIALLDHLVVHSQPVVMIQLIWWRLRLLDAPRHQWTRMHACETAVCFGMVDLSLDGDVLSLHTAEKTLDGAMHGGGLCAFRGSVLCKPLSVPYVADTMSSTAAVRRHRSSRQARRQALRLSVSLLSAHRGTVPPWEK